LRQITIEFNDRFVVRQFMLASVIWGAVGMLVGVPHRRHRSSTSGSSTSTRPGSRSAGCARCTPTPSSSRFVGNMMFAGIYYSTQRLVKARLASDFLSRSISGAGSSSSSARRSRCRSA
jgi:cytochrome c oxidase cbb3-type subunit I/II